jgi:hypothetical protein
VLKTLQIKLLPDDNQKDILLDTNGSMKHAILYPEQHGIIKYIIKYPSRN